MQFSGDFIKRLRLKDEQAFQELYRKSNRMLINYILLKVNGHVEVAEDILSEVYCDTITYSASLTLTHNIKAWLFRITKSKIADYYRKLKKEQNIIKVQKVVVKQKELWNWFSNTPESRVLVQEHQLLLKAAFARLPECNREILIKKYEEKKSMAQIAKEIKKTEKAVDNILYRSRKLFEQELKELAKEKIYFA